MKRTRALYTAYLGALVMSCSQAGPTTPGGTPSGGAPAVQGGSAGALVAGGMGGTGVGTAGTAGTNGSTAGAAPLGGSGGAAVGVAGAGGASAGAGGATVSAGSAGQPAGGAPGTAGSAAGGAGGSGDLITQVVPDLDGFVWEGTCSGTVAASGKNCPFADDTATSCPSTGTWAQKGATKKKTLTVKGVAGTKYTVNFEVRGVVGTRCYTGGMTGPGFSTTPNANGPNNTWYIGGTQYNDSIWNTYEIDVNSNLPADKKVYYANAFPMSPDWCQKEASYEVGFKASFVVVGGSTIDFIIHDANCQAQQNCGGNDAATTCDSPRTISLAGLSPAGTFAQPRTNTIGSKTYYPQWLYFDVQSVTSP